MANEMAYSEQAMQVLGRFQLLEFALKGYIAACYGIISTKLEGTIPFGYTFTSIESFPLERLLSTFAKLNTNADLQKRLNKLRDQRNDVAHRALLFRHEVLRDVLAVDLAIKTTNLHQTASELDECLGLMASELEDVVKKYNAARLTNA